MFHEIDFNVKDEIQILNHRNRLDIIHDKVNSCHQTAEAGPDSKIFTN